MFSFTVDVILSLFRQNALLAKRNALLPVSIPYMLPVRFVTLPVKPLKVIIGLKLAFTSRLHAKVSLFDAACERVDCISMEYVKPATRNAFAKPSPETMENLLMLPWLV